MKRKFFTLTELMVVIAIIVILAGMLIGGAGYAGRRADEAAAQAFSSFAKGLEGDGGDRATPSANGVQTRGSNA